MPTSETTIEQLSPSDCWALLLGSGMGRLATAAGGEADVFPVNYFVHDQAILFRTAAGSKLDDIARAPRVAFEVDGVDTRWHWSVVAHGEAAQLESQTEALESGVTELVSWSPTEKHIYVRITVRDITGRRIDRHAFPRTSLWG